MDLLFPYFYNSGPFGGIPTILFYLNFKLSIVVVVSDVFGWSTMIDAAVDITSSSGFYSRIDGDTNNPSTAAAC